MPRLPFHCAGMQYGLLPTTVPHINNVISVNESLIHQLLSEPELKLGLDKKNLPMQGPKNLPCANKEKPDRLT